MRNTCAGAQGAELGSPLTSQSTDSHKSRSQHHFDATEVWGPKQIGWSCLGPQHSARLCRNNKCRWRRFLSESGLFEAKSGQMLRRRAHRWTLHRDPRELAPSSIVCMCMLTAVPLRKSFRSNPFRCAF